MADYKSLTASQQAAFGDPYHIGFVTILIQLTAITTGDDVPWAKNRPGV
jgi:hypothetical protein